MKMIKKYTLTMGMTNIMADAHGEILCAQRQGNSLMLWIKEDNEAQKIARIIYILPTGQEFADIPMKYIDTVQMGDYVWHVFEKVQ